ncbi:NUDIX domain-containing protein [Aeromicrobium sp.]|nr:NUDIX domain-containing protein [Candidatus Saccharibacteria bacterium]
MLGFSGGKFESVESPEQAAAREVLEETVLKPILSAVSRRVTSTHPCLCLLYYLQTETKCRYS